MARQKEKVNEKQKKRFQEKEGLRRNETEWQQGPQCKRGRYDSQAPLSQGGPSSDVKR